MNLKQSLEKADLISQEGMACGKPSDEATHIINQVLQELINKLKFKNEDKEGKEK